MADDVLRIERRERIAILTLNRPDRLNALSVELREALTRACQELRNDDNVWAVILTGAGRGFCSGVDLRTPRADSESSPSRQERLDVYGGVGRQAMAVYRTLDKPIIAAVNGVAAGAGMSLALSCDMRVGSELTRFKTVFIERSLSPDSGMSFFLPRIVGSYSMIKFFVLDGLSSEVVAVSTDSAPDSALAPSFFTRPSGPLPSPIIRCPAGLARLKSSIMPSGRAHPQWPGDTDGDWQASPLRKCLC